ncbi:MAG TPA: glutamate 5-kinase [Actinomycetota bacterium]|nr:glutamate 5-kinase [Actinomycetota bacterium]
MARRSVAVGEVLVVKVGTSSLVGPTGEPDEARVANLVDGIVALRRRDVRVVLVSSGAIGAGLRRLGFDSRPADIPSLQAAAAVGQGRLYAAYSRLLRDADVVAAQILLTRYDFMHRQQYLNARNTLDRLLDLGALPIVNENDTIAVDEIRFGDNDRLAALVAHLTKAKLLALLTDTSGLFEADPRRHPGASVVDEVDEITPELERAAGGRGSELASGGMASKVAAAWVATFSGVGVVVADASEPDVLSRIASGDKIGTYFHPHPRKISARRLWIAFAQPPKGTVVVDAGARRAVASDNRSLLAVGVVDVKGTFAPGDTVDIAVEGGGVFARGLVRFSAEELTAARGRKTIELSGREVVHKDHLIILERGSDA